MKALISIVFVLLLPIAGMAQSLTQPDVSETPEPASGLTTFPADKVKLDDFLWVARPLVVFTDTAADPRFRRQMDLLAEHPDDLAERDIVVIVDSDPNSASDARSRLHPRGFALVILDKDGSILMRKPLPWSTREISRAIDKTPLRQQEILDKKEQGLSPTETEG